MKTSRWNLHILSQDGASLVTQLVKNFPAMWETCVRSLGWEAPLEKGKATYSSILAWRIPWTTVHGVAKSWTRLSDFHFHLSQTIGREGYLSINTESNSININAHIPKQTGSTHKPLSLKEKEKKKGQKKKGSVSKNSIGILAWSSLPCQQCLKRKENLKSVCIKVPFPMAEGLIKIFRCFSAAWKAVFMKFIYYYKWLQQLSRSKAL